MDTVVPKYKKKRNCPKGEPPSLYPIGIHNGVLKGDSVWVTDEQSIEIISTMGCYGQIFGLTESNRQRFVSRQGRLVQQNLNGPPSPGLENADKQLPSTSTTSVEAEVSDAYSSESEADERTTVEDTSTVETTTIDTAGPTLVLTSEEAFFLAYGLGCLLVSNPSDQHFTLEKFWHLVKQKEDFLSKYAVYHFYRSRGWVVKNGTSYGCDYVLYKDGPAYYHSSFGVKIVPPPQLDAPPLVTTRWPLLSGLTRVVSHVNKDLIIAYVILDEDFHKDDLNHPICLNKFKIKEMWIKSWFPGKDRIEQQNKQQMTEEKVPNLQ